MKKLLLTLAVCAVALSSLRCGYTTSSTLPGHLRTVHVKQIKNKVDFAAERSRNLYIPLIEVDVRNAIIDRFLFDGNLKIAEEDTADLILSGELTSYDRGALRFTEGDDPEEYRVRVVVNLTMYDTHDEVEMWAEPGFAGEAEFFITGPLATPEEDAVREAIEDLARRIVERTVEDW